MMFKFLGKKNRATQKPTPLSAPTPTVPVEVVPETRSEQPTVAFRTSPEVIGNAAGQVWNLLAQTGPLSFEDVILQVKNQNSETTLCRDLIMQAIGWLARENKVEIVDWNAGQTVGLTTDECGSKAA